MNLIFLLTWLALIAVQAVWTWGDPAVMAVSLGPLLLTALFLFRGNPRRRAIASLLSLPYFTVGTTEWMVDQQLEGALTVLLCTVLYLVIVAANVRDRQPAE